MNPHPPVTKRFIDLKSKFVFNSMSRKIWYSPNKFESYGDEEIRAVTQCLRDGWLAGFGPKTVEFEEKVANIFGKKYGLFVNSGSSACLLALASLDLPKGSEILTPACTFATTVSPIVQLGYVPKFCDVGLNSYVPSVDQVLNAVTENTKVVYLPNLIGNTPDWKLLREKLPNIILIEDSADTITTTPDSDISTTSFYASHIITACGSGGMVMFNDEKHLKRARMFRDWGRIGDNSEDMNDRFNFEIDGIPYDYKFLYGCMGYNFKSSEVNAAFGLVQLEKFDGFKKTRRENLARYLENLKDVPGILLPDDKMEPNWLGIPMQYEKRLDLLKFLESNDIQTRVAFSGNITRHPAFRGYLEPFENADTIMKNGFILGCHHGMSLDDVDYVCDKIKEYMNSQ
jgi:CDP-6-deoxy-D-xylo-4-hexulose-3-dehydrase